jgi:hypothetical protein
MSDEDAAIAVDLPVDRVRELRSLHLGHEHRQITRSAGVRRSLAQLAAIAEDRRDALRQQIAVGDSLSRVSALGRRVLFESLGALDMLADDPEALRVRPPSSKQARRFVLEGVLDTLRQELAEVAPQSRRVKREAVVDVVVEATAIEAAIETIEAPAIESIAPLESFPEPSQSIAGTPVELPPVKPVLRSLAGLPRRNTGVAETTAAETTTPSSSTPLRSLRALPSRQHTRLF